MNDRAVGDDVFLAFLVGVALGIFANLHTRRKHGVAVHVVRFQHFQPGVAELTADGIADCFDE